MKGAKGGNLKVWRTYCVVDTVTQGHGQADVPREYKVTFPKFISCRKKLYC